MKDELVLTRQQWNDLVLSGYEGAKGDGNMIQCLARVPHELQRCKEVLPCTPFTQTTVMELKHEVQSLRQSCKSIIAGLCHRLDAIDECSIPITLRSHIHAHYACIYGMGLATGILLNCILGMLGDDCIGLCEESAHHSNEILQLAKIAVKYQPLGSAAMILCLSAAWLGAPDSTTKDGVRSLLSDYERACLGLFQSDLTADLERLSARFTSKHISQYEVRSL